ncbi:MAG: sulfotransferase family 2 domain-containing protein [Hyphomonadaceae bacterium]
MIVSHRNKFIFTAIPKTGTHAVRRALRVQMGPDDLEQVGLFVEKILPYPPLAELRHGHISLAQIRPFVGEEIFAGYFKFAFVRNPFDRFVSYCAFMTREDRAFERDPRAVMRYFMFKDRPVDHLLFHPQHTFVTDSGGALLTDAVGRVEQMQASYDAICAHLGLPTAPLERVNSSRRADYRGYYDRDLIEAVGDFYRKDLDLFGYKFDGTPS